MSASEAEAQLPAVRKLPPDLAATLEDIFQRMGTEHEAQYWMKAFVLLSYYYVNTWTNSGELQRALDLLQAHVGDDAAVIFMDLVNRYRTSFQQSMMG